MKILVQNCLNHLYLKAPNEWTDNTAEAQSFTTSENAIEFCAEYHLPAVQIVLKFDLDHFNVMVPITPECEQGESQKALLY